MARWSPVLEPICGLISVTEVLVLLVCHGGPNFWGHVSSLGLLGAVIASLVGPDVVEEQTKGRESTASLGAHNSQLGRAEVWRILGLEGLRSDDVSNREGARDNCGRKSTLGGTGTVGNSPLKAVSKVFYIAACE